MQTQPWLRDPAVVPIPWRQNVIDEYSARANADGTAKEKPLKLGIVWTNNVVGPHPPIKRGMKMVVDAIKAAGHKARPTKQEKSKQCRYHTNFGF